MSPARAATSTARAARSPVSGLQYNRWRYYDAAIGGWTQEDPIGFAAGDPNLYRYVGNSPTTWRDPFGLKRADIDGADDAGSSAERTPTSAARSDPSPASCGDGLSTIVWS